VNREEMKVTLKFEEGAEEAHQALKVTLPRKWKDMGTKQLKGFFVENYNKKHSEHALQEDGVHLVNSKGQALSDNDVIARVFQHGDHIRVKPGAAPERLLALHDNGDEKQQYKPPKNVNTIPTPSSGPDRVGSAAALEQAQKVDFDYSKWDRLDLSDDDGDDCHPNIDKESWKRLMKQKREERRKEEEEKIQAFKDKIQKYKDKFEKLEEKINEAGSDEPDLAQWMVDQDDAKDSMEKYQSRLDHFLATRKLTADDVAAVSQDKTVVAQKADITPLDTGLSEPKQTQEDNEKKGASFPEKPKDGFETYDAYVKLHRKTIDEFAGLRSDETSEAFLLENPQILHEHAEAYLLLLTLDTCMRHLEEKEKNEKFSKKMDEAFEEEEITIARQHLIIQFVLTLAKDKHRDPRDFVRAFFAKTSKNSSQRVDGFEDGLKAFVQRIRNRASDKRKAGEPSPLAYHRKQDNGQIVEIDDEQYELASVGPGGLDPNEVLSTLPRSLQEAFIKQDVDALKEAFGKLPPEQARYHFKRCIDSGLWNPGPENDQDYEGDEEEEDEEQQ